MTRRCPACGRVYGAEIPYCEDDFSALIPYDPPVSTPRSQSPTGDPDPPAPSETSQPTGAPVAPEARREPWSTDDCWNCGTASPSPSNTECLNPSCRRSLIPPALLIRFRDGQVEVNVGAHAELGRTGRHARLFRSFTNVSRRHAVVGVDPDGRAWIEPRSTPNGTFLNGKELTMPVQSDLQTGDSLRLARDADGEVRLYAVGGHAA